MKRIENTSAVTALFLMGIGIVQVILGETVSQSIALTANGIDCMGDGLVSGVVWVGLKVFRKPADHKFHYGYYKIENIASIGAAIIMVLLAGYIVYRSYFQLIDPHEVQAPLLGIIVASFAAIVAVILGIRKYLEWKKNRLSSLKLDAINTIKDGVASFLVVIALILSSHGLPIADALVGFVIAAIILSIGFTAVKEAGYILVDACDGYCIDQRDVVRGLVQNITGVRSISVIRLRRAGSVLQGEMEIEVPGEMTVLALDEIKSAIQKAVKKNLADMEKLTITAVPYKEKT